MQDYGNARFFSKTIEGIEEAVVLIAVIENRFSIFFFGKFQRKGRMLKSFKENLPLNQLDLVLDLYEAQCHVKTKSLCNLLLYVFARMMICSNSPRHISIGKKLCHKKGFCLCKPENKSAILERIKNLKSGRIDSLPDIFKN